jgi:AAA domain
MPTLRSVGLHPELRKRLVTESVHATRARGSHEAEPSMHTVIETTPGSRSIAVETPRALLTRPPDQLRLLQPPLATTPRRKRSAATTSISEAEVSRLRLDVAQSMFSETKFGNYVRRIKQRLQDGATSSGLVRVSGTLSVNDSLLCSLRDCHAWRVFDLLDTSGWSVTGSRHLDQLLRFPPEFSFAFKNPLLFHGPEGYVIQLAGMPASGKTQLALSMAASYGLTHAMTQAAGPNVWYLYSSPTALNAHVRRLADLLSLRARTLPHELNQSGGDDWATWALDRTVFLSVHDDFSILAALADIETNLNLCYCSESTVLQTRLIVLDSASACLAGANNHILLVQVGRTLQRLARDFGITVLVVNGAGTEIRTPSNSTRRLQRPALGVVWSSHMDISVWLHSHGVDQEHRTLIQAQLDRHPVRACESSKEECFIAISSRGVEEVSIPEASDTAK